MPQTPPSDKESEFYMTDRNDAAIVRNKRGILIYGHIEQLVIQRLELECEGLQGDMDDDSLLKDFVGSWKRYKEVISWLRKTIPLFLHHLRSTNGKGEGQTLHELFSILLLDKIEAALREATLRLIHREKNGEWIDQAFMRLVSVGSFMRYKG